MDPCEGKEVDDEEAFDIESDMPRWKQWHRVYYSEPATRGRRRARSGKVYLLVRRVPQLDESKEMWVATCNKRTTFLADLKDKRYRATRNPRIKEWEEF